MNRADGIGEIEGKGRRGDRVSREMSEFQIRDIRGPRQENFHFFENFALQFP